MVAKAEGKAAAKANRRVEARIVERVTRVGEKERAGAVETAGR
jgi:hypothetical protein